MARKQIEIKPGKGPSGAGFLGGLIFCVIGLFVVIPIFGAFGILWTLVAAVITVFHGMNLFSEKGMASYQVSIEDGGEAEENGSKEDHGETAAGQEAVSSVEERLLQLRRLYEDRLITAEEYEVKRKEILEEL